LARCGLNRRDIAINILDPVVLGEAGIRLRFNFEGGDTIGQPGWLALRFWYQPLS
jgi:hypothetical protein